MIIQYTLSYINLVTAIEIVVASPQISRTSWKWSIPKVTDIYEICNDDDDFKHLARILDDVGYNIENDKKKEYNLYYYLLLKLYNIN